MECCSPIGARPVLPGNRPLIGPRNRRSSPSLGAVRTPRSSPLLSAAVPRRRYALRRIPPHRIEACGRDFPPDDSPSPAPAGLRRRSSRVRGHPAADDDSHAAGCTYGQRPPPRPRHRRALCRENVRPRAGRRSRTTATTSASHANMRSAQRPRVRGIFMQCICESLWLLPTGSAVRRHSRFTP